MKRRDFVIDHYMLGWFAFTFTLTVFISLFMFLHFDYSHIHELSLLFASYLAFSIIPLVHFIILIIHLINTLHNYKIDQLEEYIIKKYIELKEIDDELECIEI